MTKSNLKSKIILGGIATVMLCAMTTSGRVDNFYSEIDRQSYPIAYRYELHNPPEGGQGILQDQCNGGPFVTQPQLPTGGYDEYPIYACADIGPYLPPDWPY